MTKVKKLNWAFQYVEDRFLDITDETAAVKSRGQTSAAVHLPIRKAVLIAAAVLALLVVTACSIYIAHWSQGLRERFNATESEMRQADESGLSVYPSVSDSAGGITVGVRQTVVDNDTAYITLSVEGYEVPEGKYPAVGHIFVTVDGENPSMMTGGFPDKGPYTGTLEYSITLSAREGKGPLTGKEVRILIEGLGTGQKLVYTPIVNETWELTWTLQGTAELRTVSLGREIGDTGVILEEAELSPTSLRLLCQTETEWEGWKTMELFQPRPVGLRLKDGTELLCLTPGGAEGYTDIENLLFMIEVGSTKLLQPEEVDALLFAYTYAGGMVPEDAELYAVFLE